MEESDDYEFLSEELLIRLESDAPEELSEKLSTSLERDASKELPLPQEGESYEDMSDILETADSEAVSQAVDSDSENCEERCRELSTSQTNEDIK